MDVIELMLLLLLLVCGKRLQSGECKELQPRYGNTFRTGEEASTGWRRRYHNACRMQAPRGRGRHHSGGLTEYGENCLL